MTMTTTATTTTRLLLFVVKQILENENPFPGPQSIRESLFNLLTTFILLNKRCVMVLTTQVKRSWQATKSMWVNRIAQQQADGKPISKGSLPFRTKTMLIQKQGSHHNYLLKPLTNNKPFPNGPIFLTSMLAGMSKVKVNKPPPKKRN